MLLEHRAGVAGGHETAADQHTMPIADAQLVLGVHHVHGGLDGVGQIRLAGHPVAAEHAHGHLFQILGRHDAFAPRVLGHHHMAEQRFEHAQVLLHLLVTHHGDDADQLREIVVLLDGGAQRLGGVHVMPAVDDDRRRGAHLLDAARHLHAAQRLGHDIRVQLSGNRDHRLGGGERGQRVVRLMLTELGDRDLRVLPQRGAQRDQLSANGRGARDDLHLVPVAQHPGVIAFGRLLQDRHHGLLVRLRADHGGAAGLDDAGLLGGDLLDRIAQPLHVVHIHRSDDGRVGVQHVGGVPGTPHAHLHDGHVHRRVGKLPDRHGGQHLEEAHPRLAGLFHLHVHQIDQILDLIPGVHEVVVAQRLAVDGDAFVDAFQMRRGVQAGAHAVGAADGLRHAGRGALAVGAGDVDDAERLLRMTQHVEHQVHPVQIQVGGVVFRRPAHDLALDLVDGCVAPVRMLE